ncbi:hypothetical protein F1B92_08445, partial [Campylobacter sp. FMV-PI01]
MDSVNETIKFGKDVIKGAFDTLVVAPFDFGMFLGNLSGLAGKEQQLKAQAELLVAKEAISAIYNNTGGARDYFAKEIGKDLSERPGYYIGAFGSGFLIKAPAIATTFGGETIALNKAEQILNKLSGTAMTTGGKIDMLLNDMYDKFLDYTGQIFDTGSYSFYDLIDDLGDWLDNFGDFLDGFINPLLYDPLALDLDG